MVKDHINPRNSVSELFCDSLDEVLRIVTVKAPLANSRINWVCDSPPSQSHHIAPGQTLLKNKNRNHDTKARNNNSVPRNVYPPPSRQGKESTETPLAPSSDVRVRAPLTHIDSSVWCNSSQEICPPVPRNNITNRLTSTTATAPPPPKRKRNRVQRRERRAIERAERGEIFNHTWWAAQSSGAPPSPIVPDQLTTLGLPHSDPISAMRPAVYPPVTQQGRPLANHNSSLQFDQELGESAGLYKAPVPDPQHHFRNSTWACSSEDDPPSPTRTSWACKLRSQAQDRNYIPPATMPTTPRYPHHCGSCLSSRTCCPTP